ncbi:MAG: 5-methyltetrahydropteroyltriglutamate--homocysteine S-methyltransferase [Thermomicrobiales bacterium]
MDAVAQPPTSTSTIASVPGYPRIGTHREVKKALEAFWSGKITAEELATTADTIRNAGWESQSAAGLDLLPVNDFSLYDQVLDTIALFGAVPARYGWTGETVDLDTYFAMARGRTGEHDVPAMEMTKWFDTNYHNIVPELGPETIFRIASTKPLDSLRAAQALGHQAKVVLLGPVTFLALAKPTVDGFDPLTLLDRLLPLYTQVVKELADNGAEWIQIDEPILVTDFPEGTLPTLEKAHAAIAAVKGGAKVIVQTYFDHVGEADHYKTLVNLPVDGIGFDLGPLRGRKNLDFIAEYGFPKDKVLVAGVVDGRNIWINDLAASFGTLTALAEQVGVGNLHVSTSCSLQHVPYDVTRETGIDTEVRSWLVFAEQKLAEVALLAKGLREGRDAIAADLDARTALLNDAARSPKRRNPAVQNRLAALPADAINRALPYAERATLQQEKLHLPLLPTTTIGSFPQTPELRVERRKHDRGEVSNADYEAFLEGQIRDVIAHQEALGIDVLVHGEPERNDMVQYFGEQLDGFAFTQQGWVQSYGSRYVRPPVIFGDVSRPKPMTVRWATFAQSLSEKPVKGMLTGPVTILNWSFVRDDQPREVTCKQIALAIRDEVSDLEAAGIAIIQIDEAALREGLPLHRADWQHYLDWAVASFRITAAGAAPETQVHTHMCYSEFGDIFQAISDLDADVISIENARSGLELLRSFREQGYDKGVGPGVYDIHSPRVPPVAEIARNLEATLSVLDRERVWVNPDCGLKTRKAPETEAALRNMVEAAQQVRATIGEPVPTV